MSEWIPPSLVLVEVASIAHSVSYTASVPPDALGPPAAGRSLISRTALALLFFRLGLIGFGGGMAVVALIELEIVQRRALMDSEEFLHGVALGQLMGPLAVNTAMFVGSRLYGFRSGLICAGAFLAPSVVIVILLSWLYFTYHSIPALQSALAGVAPVVIALIVSAAWSMGRKAVRSWPAIVLVVVAASLAALKVNSLYLIAAGAIVGAWLGDHRLSGRPTDPPTVPPAPSEPPVSTGSLGVFTGMSLTSAASAMAVAPSLSLLTWTFLKTGVVFVGGGFVLVPILHHSLVLSLGWLTEREFLDGVAISNLTPGPIAVLATFTGYRVHGIVGALAATLALFAPAVILMSILSRFYAHLKDVNFVRDLLAGLSPAVVGLVLGAALLLAPGALIGPAAWGMCALALALLLRWRWHPGFVLALGALAGIAGVVR